MYDDESLLGRYVGGVNLVPNGDISLVVHQDQDATAGVHHRTRVTAFKKRPDGSKAM
jgi:hypothetical protein